MRLKNRTFLLKVILIDRGNTIIFQLLVIDKGNLTYLIVCI